MSRGALGLPKLEPGGKTCK